MAVGIVVGVRNDMLDAITAAIGSNGLLRIFSGSRPATGGSETTMLAELALSATAAPAASSGVLTFNAITNDNVVTDGTASWFRICQSDGTPVLDGSVGTSTEDLVFNSVAFVTGAVVSISSLTITANNA